MSVENCLDSFVVIVVMSGVLAVGHIPRRRHGSTIDCWVSVTTHKLPAIRSTL